MNVETATADELAGICGNGGDEAAWNEFVRRFQRPIALAVLRAARAWGEPATSVVDDLVQETFLRLCADNCRRLREFTPRQPDSIVAFLRLVAANVTHDHFRSQASHRRGGALRRVEFGAGDAEELPAAALRLGSLETDLQIGEIDRILGRFAPEVIPERDRAIFWLYYRQGFTARDIGAMESFGLSVKGVESAIHRTTSLLRDAMQPNPSAPAKGIVPPSPLSKVER